MCNSNVYDMAPAYLSDEITLHSEIAAQSIIIYV